MSPISQNLTNLLSSWAETKPTIRRLLVFGSRATGRSRPSVDLDLAFSFVDDIAGNPLSELIA